MARKIQHKRGLEANLPQLDVAEIAFTTDSKKPFIGSADGNVEIAKKADVDEKASKTELTNAVSPKADKTYVDTELGKKASTDEVSALSAQLAEKASQADVTAAVEPKADKTYVDTKVSQVADGAPKGTYATLSDLQAAHPSGDSGNYVLQSDGHIYNWDGTAWVDTGILYQAAGIADRSVTAAKRTALGESGYLFTSSNSPIPNFDGVNNTLTISPTSWVVHRKTRYTLNTQYVVPLDAGYTIQVLVFNVDTQSFKFVATAFVGNITENEVILASVVREPTENTVSVLWSTFKYTVNGKPVQVTSNEIKTGAVNYTKTDFIDVGKNKAIKDPLQGISITASHTVAESQYKNTSFSFLAMVEKGKTYTIRKFEGGNRFRLALLKEYPNPRKLPLSSIWFYDGSDSSAEQTHTFTNNYDANYLVVFTNSDNTSLPNVQVEEGATATSYEEFTWKMFGKNISSLSSGNAKASGSSLTVGKNKFDGSFVDNVYVGVNGDVALSTSTYVPNTKSAVVPLEKGKTYTFKKYEGGDRLRFAIVSEYPDIDKLPLTPLYYVATDIQTGEEYTHTFTNNYGLKDVNYLVIYTNAYEAEEPLIQVEEGTTATEYEEYELQFMGKPLPLADKRETEGYFFLDSIDGIYSAPDLPSVAPGQPFDLQTSVHGDIYAIYDEMVANNPNYITRKTLGTDGIGNPIHQYTFVSTTAQSDIEPKRPKIILLSGVHGDEKMSVWGLVQFLKDMCENWKNDHILEFIRWNFELVVVPMCNPSGYDLDQRKNQNGVDINRNFPTDSWTLMNDPNDINYGGPSPNSEAETQILVNFYNEHLDADYSIDYHNFIQDAVSIMWAPTKVRENKLLAMNVMSTMDRKWKKEYDYFPQNDTIYGLVNTTYTPTTSTYSYMLGIKSMTLEIVRQITWGENSEYFDGVTAKCATELIGNTLAAIGKNIR